jgi:hypothetical protein
MQRILLTILIPMLLTSGCVSDAQWAEKERQRRLALNELYPQGMSRADVIAKFGGHEPMHVVLPSPDKNIGNWVADDGFIRWAIGDCVVRGDPPVASVDSFPTPSGYMGLGVLVVLYDADDHVIRAYWRHVD